MCTQSPKQVDTDGPPLSYFELIAATAIVICTVGFAALHWLSQDVAGLSEDSFEGLTLDWLPISEIAQHRILFTGVGFLLSYSAFLLVQDFLRSTPLIQRLTFVFRNLILAWVFLGCLIISCSILGHAFLE
jgi:hypothetical protein